MKEISLSFHFNLIVTFMFESYDTQKRRKAIALVLEEKLTPSQVARALNYTARAVRLWVRGVVADLCTPLYELMHDLLLEGHFIQLDATGAKYLDPAIKGKAGLGTIWGYHGDPMRPYVLYGFQTHGKRAGPESFLRDYHGYLQCDANVVYDQIFAPLTPAPGQRLPTEVGCWAHARRKFYDARLLQPAAHVVLDMIGVCKRSRTLIPFV